MTSRDFVYWLQGLLEIGNPETLTKEQLTIVKNHLNLVFLHEIDPSLNEGKTTEEVEKLHDVHDGKVDWNKMLNDNKPIEKEPHSPMDWLKNKFKHSHIKSGGLYSRDPNNSNINNTIYRC